MVSEHFHLAQFNIGKMRYPRHASEMNGYHDALSEVLPVALGWPGFIWIMGDDIIAAAERQYGEGVAANLSVWSDVESLKSFMNCAPHAAAMGRGGQWFVPMVEVAYVVWWIPLNGRPDFIDACRRLAELRRFGPTPEAFTLERPFPAPRWDDSLGS